MDAARFDSLVRTLAESVSRRQTIVAVALAALGIAQRDDEAAAGPGCKNVGKKCKRDKQCCSGICKGGKNKKCKAHDTGGCGKNSGFGGSPCTTSAGEEGACFTTTGNAGYCGAPGATGVLCFACKKDADCRPICGPKAACVPCPFCGTCCLGPAENSCALP